MMTNDEKKHTTIKFRISKSKKEEWMKICQNKNISLTDLIKDSVEDRLFKSERRDILKFIDNQDNIFSKIENNINQFAKHANTKKFIDSKELAEFTERLNEIVKLKQEQNQIFTNIYRLMSHDDN